MCVIYFDGNAFTQIQRHHAAGPDGLRNWDLRLESLRRSFLTSLLQTISKEPDWLNGNEIRLETLMWGGDEFLFVVPAWKGWFLLDFFFRHADSWTFADQRLSFAAGAVFSNHKAPIHRIVELARALASQAKEHSRETSSFTYQVLESFDHIHQDLPQIWSKRSAVPQLQPADFILLPADIPQLRQDVGDLKRGDFPRRTLFKFLRGVMHNPPDTSLEGKLEPYWSRQLGHGANPRSRWFHLHELWDYAI